MTKEKRKRIFEVLTLIAEDAERDGRGLDGQPFTALTVGTQFGHIFASLKTLADILKEHIENKTV